MNTNAQMWSKTKDKLMSELTSDEKAALDKCQDIVKTHTRVGSMIGGSLAVYGMYRRGYWPISKHLGRAAFFGIGGIVVGMQIGWLSAMIQSIKVVEKLPNPDHILQAMREAQIEMQDARRRPLSGERQWSQRSTRDTENGESPWPQQQQQQQQLSQMPTDNFSRGPQVSERISPSESDSIITSYNGPPMPMRPSNQQPSMSGYGGQGDAWSKIRGEQMQTRPETAWDRLRKGSSGESGRQNTDQRESNAAVSPFGQSTPIDSPDLRYSSSPAYDAADDERRKQQAEFDALLERERGQDAPPKVNRWGDA
ncbi:hypothetical protein PYCC9005_006017 [Savitreella phatthalungensis]